MSLVDLPAELLLDIAEDVCWEPEKGWDSGRLVSLAQTCRYVSSSVASFLGSSVKDAHSWPLSSRILQTLRPSIHRVRSVTVLMRWHTCGSECTREESTCIAPFVAQCQHNLVHLDLYESTDALLYNLASTVDSFSRLRFLRVGHRAVFLHIHIGAVIAVTRKSPSLEALYLIGLKSGDPTLIPEENAPFRLRYLHLVARDVDGPSFAWLCSSSVGLIEHLEVETPGENVQDMTWLDTDIAKATLAVLPRLTAHFRTKFCVAHALSYASNITHLTTHVETLPALDDLPPSLTGIHLTAWHRLSMFVPVGRLKHPDQVVTVTVDEPSRSHITSHGIAQACERAGLLFHQ
ncbi:hypothetical protein EXIGLDRAFT_732570 [Exidia glandulosa HHB12029]|uniref:F-box domain-containing protein n=1 Tax=Exidia glandulosa HHB12029 TaxID=1314781 RepID=A0A165BH71_EXIGL|nr:hypothetical protein EXIGLDRAFT_732570 [Exidia glandulosa HHB12029]